jgi:hypothetical protein
MLFEASKICTYTREDAIEWLMNAEINCRPITCQIAKDQISNAIKVLEYIYEQEDKDT